MAVVHDLLPRIIKSGLGVLAAAAGVNALASVVATAGTGPQAVVSPFDWGKLMAGARGNVFPVFREFEDFATPAPGAAAARQLPAALVPARRPKVNGCAKQRMGVSVPFKFGVICDLCRKGKESVLSLLALTQF